MAKKRTSAEKRHLQSEKRRMRNKMVKSRVRSSAKKVVLEAHAKDREAAELALHDMIKQIDKAAGKGIIKKNAAARKKSRMQKLVNQIVA